MDEIELVSTHFKTKTHNGAPPVHTRTKSAVINTAPVCLSVQRCQHVDRNQSNKHVLNCRGDKGAEVKVWVKLRQ